jgi:CelD/BcsL family acetyltransferase involved in cellulose biosynthesis
VSVALVPAAELGADEVRCWSELQRSDPDLASPFFRPEFTRAVAAVRGDAFVAVLGEGSGPRGFFPFQRDRWGIGRPIGGAMSDYHGLIGARSLSVDAQALLRACRLRVWDFDHLVASQRAFAPYHARLCGSPVLDLSGGFERYRAGRSAAGSKVIAQADRKARKLAREVGPTRLDVDAADPAALHRLLSWKSAQYRRTGVNDGRVPRWRVELLERILGTRTDEFAGVLTTLWAGDRMVAAHMGMRSQTTLHWWFPAYDPDCGRFSPGVALLVGLARNAERLGLRTIDLGRGEEPYKARLSNATVSLAEGAVVRTWPVAAGRRLTRGAKHLVRRTPAAAPGRRAARWVRGRRDELGASAR